ncbi:hypothetical protein [Streptomyces sp. CA-106131]|uniref:hypothetical protein n=1 Tax=Streptomyces sp. CA-106131 TaxID=3240045 RepID=UPI003D8B0E72
MPEQTVTAFPKDLLDARRELHEVHAELHAFLEDKPWSVGPSEGWDDVETGRWSPSVRPATDGWAEEDIRAREALQERIWKLSEFVITHTFWGTLSGPDRVDARTELIQASMPAPAETESTG